MGERAVHECLVARPHLPFAGLWPELDIRDHSYRCRPLELVRVDLVIGGERPRWARVGRADVDEGNSRGVWSQRLAHRGKARARVADDGPLAGIESLSQER